MKKLLAILLAIVMVVGSQAAVFAAADSNTGRDLAVENGYAQQLKELGLFKGVSDTNFDLNRAPSRVEAIVMLIRLLGEEGTALSGNYTHPFTDVPAWADAYVGYAYENGLTKGMSATKFGSGTANAQMYTTYVLRALGYSDANGLDFTYENPFTLAEDCGIMPSSVDKKSFLRADAVTISHASMVASLKNQEKTLAEDLIEKGIIAKDTYHDSYNETIQNTFTSEWVEEYKKLKVTVFGKIDNDARYRAAYGGLGDYCYSEYTGEELKNNNCEMMCEKGWRIRTATPKVLLRMFPNGVDPEDIDGFADWSYGRDVGENGYFSPIPYSILREMKEEYNGLKPGEEKVESGKDKISITQEGDLRFRVHISDNSLDTAKVRKLEFEWIFAVEGCDEYECADGIGVIDDGDYIVDLSRWEEKYREYPLYGLTQKEFSYNYTIEYLNHATITYTGTYKL